MSVAPGHLNARSPTWLPDALTRLRTVGYAIVTDVLPPSFVEEVRPAMYGVQEKIRRDIGQERLDRAGEVGVLRLMFKYDPLFFKFLEVPEALAVVDAMIGDTAILHTQNGFVLPSLADLVPGAVFQNSFHRDFPRYLNGYVASVNAMFAIDAFTERNGATTVVSGTHQQENRPTPDQLALGAIPVECPAGSMFVFDSTLWHAAGNNRSGFDRLAMNQQFTRSYIKQQIDFVRAVGDDVAQVQKPRTQQLLGWYTRVVTSLDEYYRPEADRLYRKGQG